MDARTSGAVVEMTRRVAALRVPLGYAAGAIALWLASPTPRSLTIGALVGTAGEALRIWAAGHLEKGLEVTNTGPYALTRHPLYAGSIVMGAGAAIAANSVAVAALVFAYLAITITAAIRSEEAHLTAKFGTEYPAYRDGRSPSASRRFSLERAVRNKEYRALLGLAVVLLLLAARMFL
jgi:protein-S-isoprenylcysteine O-methyltransferase Ste14